MATTKIPVELSSTPGIVDNSNATAITIDSSENVLIGTDSGDGFNSNSALRLQKSNHNYLQIKTPTNKQGGVLIGDTGDDFVGGFIYSNNDDQLWIYSGNDRAIVCDSSQNVGLGTISPDYPLEVENTGVYHVNIKQTKTSTSDTSAYATYYLQNLAGSSGTISGYLGAGGAGVGNAAMRNTVYMGAQSNHEVAIFTNDVERVRINTSGNVGIGAGISYNASANNSLTIGATNRTSVDNGRYFNFQFKVSGGATGQDLIIQAARNIDGSSEDTESIFQYDTSADAQIFYTNGVERARIDSSGSVGIGTTSPTSKLNIDTAADQGIAIFRTGTNANFDAIQFRKSNNSDLNSRIGFNSNHLRLDGTSDILFGIGSSFTETMRLNSTGLGIGTSSIDEKLHVEAGNIKIEAGAVSTTRGLIIAHSGQTGNLTKLEQSAGGNPHGILHTTERALRISAGSGGGTGTAETLSFHTNASRAMTIDTSQNVGIGTSSPSRILDVEVSGGNAIGSVVSGTSSIAGFVFGDTGADDQGGVLYNNNGDYQYFRTGGAERLRIDSTGKVGIGITNPSQLLTLKANTPFIQFAQDGSDSYAGINFGDADDANDGQILYDHDSRYMRFQVANAERIRIDASGNVGIGTTSPSAKVHSYTGTTNGQSFHAQGLGGNNFKIVPYCSNGAFSSLTSEDDVCLIAQNAGGIVLGHHASGYYGMRVQSTGTINIGTKTEANGSTGGCSFSADSSNRRNFICATTGSGNLELIEFRNPNGTVGTIRSNGSSTSYNTSSDYRLKENVNYTWDATSRLKQLKPARFNFKTDTDITLDGFLAHEVSSVVPQAISGEKDGEKMQSIDHSKLVPLLVKTIQELEARIKVLEDK